ncbi:repeat element 22 protein [Diadegma fenestrale ichnovirus]|nr:repeat element 16 protein [Diadegma fenestrale ichnovirus]ULM71664.1 repeat element 22 protein [Diadegma fenestrale ichnovirus]
MKICDMGIPKDKCSFTDFGEVFGRCPGSVTIRKTFLGLVFLRALYIGNNTSRKPPAVPPLPAGMKANLLLKKILGIAESMEFEEYQRIIENILHKTHLHPKMQEQLRQISTRQFTATFLNGKPLVIRYNYDPSRVEEERVLFDVNSLLPVLGGVVAPALSRFASSSQIHGSVKKHVHLNLCDNGEHASCPCHLGRNQAQVRAFVQPAVDACRDGCFHHYCSQHVGHWFQFYLVQVVLLRERRAGSTDDRDAAESFLVFLSETVYFAGFNVHFRNSKL